MGSRVMFLRVGLLILVGIGALIGLVLFLNGTNFNNGVELETYFKESVGGLDAGAPVKYLGVTLGRVTDIGLVSAEYGRGEPIDVRRATFRLVYVRFAIDPTKIGRTITTSGLADAVKAGLRTSVATQGITGLSYLSLDFVNAQQFPAVSVPWTPRYPYVPSVPSTISRVQTAAEQLAATLEQIDFKGIAVGLLGLTRDLQQELENGQTHQVLAAAATLLDSLHQSLDKADLPGLAASLRKDSDAIGTLVRGEEAQQLFANANRASAELADAARRLPPLVASLSGTTVRTDAAAAELERRMTSILSDLQATAGNLRDITDALRANPAGTLFGGPPPRSNGNGQGGDR